MLESNGGVCRRQPKPDCMLSVCSFQLKYVRVDHETLARLEKVALRCGYGEHVDRPQRRVIETLVPELLEATESYLKQACGHRFRLKKWRLQENQGSKRERVDIAPHAFHIDRQRYAKLMLYLTDVSASDGPLEVALGEAFSSDFVPRRTLSRSKREDGLNVVDVVDFESLTGSRGTAIIFDTDRPHRQKPLEEGKSRKVVRFDFAPRNSLIGWMLTLGGRLPSRANW